MATSALTTATASALTSTLPESASKSNQQSPRNTPNAATIAVQTGQVDVSKILQEGEKFIKWDEVSSAQIFMRWLCNESAREEFFFLLHSESYQIASSPLLAFERVSRIWCWMAKIFSLLTQICGTNTHCARSCSLSAIMDHKKTENGWWGKRVYIGILWHEMDEGLVVKYRERLTGFLFFLWARLTYERY